MSTDAPVERPNLLATMSVVLATFATMAQTCLCTVYGVIFSMPVSGILSLLAVLLGIAARAQARQTGHGADNAWWGLALGSVNLSLNLLLMATFGGAMVVALIVEAMP